MKRALIYVWDNPPIVDSCLSLASCLTVMGFRPFFIMPSRECRERVAGRGYDHVALDSIVAGCRESRDEWVSGKREASFREIEWRGIDIYDETEYERRCLSLGYAYPLGQASTIRGLTDDALCCIEAFGRILEQYRPEVCYVWNGLVFPPKALRRLCEERSIPVFSLERGLLPGFMVVDRRGVNFAGSLGGNEWDLIESSGLKTDMSLAGEYIRKFGEEGKSIVNEGLVMGREELRSYLGIPAGKKVILIPNQIDSDTNIICFSRNYPRNADVISGIARVARKAGDAFLVVKTHPEDTDREVNGFGKALDGGLGCVVRDVHVHALIGLADLVVVRNSTVGLEALIMGKPVVCLGQSAYSGKGFTYDVESPGDCEDALNRALSSGNPSVAQEERFLSFLSYLLRGYHFDLSAGPGTEEYNRHFLASGIAREVTDLAHPDKKATRTTKVVKKDGGFRVIALVAARNEGDVIYHVIRALVDEGVEVYLVDHNSDDNTVEEASRWLNKGLIHIEHFTGDRVGAEAGGDRYVWAELLRRKEELARELRADWFIHHDADEFRESPWPGVSLRDGIRVVDSLGYNAIDFELFNFRPTDDSFEPGSDVRQALRFYEGGADFDSVQIKAWKKGRTGIDLQSTGGHEAKFGARKVFPIKFILRHYPVRSQAHGERKVFRERKGRFLENETERGWHVQYENVRQDHCFLYEPDRLLSYDEGAARLTVLSGGHDMTAHASEWEKTRTYVKELERTVQELEEELDDMRNSHGWKALSRYYGVRDRVLSVARKGERGG